MHSFLILPILKFYHHFDAFQHFIGLPFSVKYIKSEFNICYRSTVQLFWASENGWRYKWYRNGYNFETWKSSAVMSTGKIWGGTNKNPCGHPKIYGSSAIQIRYHLMSSRLQADGEETHFIFILPLSPSAAYNRSAQCSVSLQAYKAEFCNRATESDLRIMMILLEFPW